MYCPNPDCPDHVATGTPGEYRSDVEICPVCGTTLVHALPDGWPGTAEDPGREGRGRRRWSGEPEPVFECTDPAEVPVVKSILDGAGIPYVTRGEETFDAWHGGRSPLRFSPRAGIIVFVVPADLAEEALALLQEVDEGFEGERGSE